MLEIIINDNICGGRLDKTVLKYLDNAPKNFVYKMLRKKNIVLNGKKASGSEILNSGDKITFFLSDDTINKFHTSKENSDRSSSKSRNNQNSNFKKMIIFEDDNIIAINKPSGILSQDAGGSEISLNDMLLKYLGKDDLFTPGISNRLDRNTSGIVLAGKNPNSVRLLNESIKLHRLRKIYLSLACGKIKDDMVLEGYLAKDDSVNKAVILNSDDPHFDKISSVKTICHVLSGNDNCTLLQIELVTGKTHQIRAHLGSIGHGCIGDMKYGSQKINELFFRKYGVRSQLLHAYETVFTNMPEALNYLNNIKITAPVPEEFRRAVKGENLCLPGDQED